MTDVRVSRVGIEILITEAPPPASFDSSLASVASVSATLDAIKLLQASILSESGIVASLGRDIMLSAKLSVISKLVSRCVNTNIKAALDYYVDEDAARRNRHRRR